MDPWRSLEIHLGFDGILLGFFEDFRRFLEILWDSWRFFGILGDSWRFFEDSWRSIKGSMGFFGDSLGILLGFLEDSWRDFMGFF